jgi:hypothetical protein
MEIERVDSKYHYAIIRYMPDPARGEGLNVGVVVRSDKEQVVKWNKHFSPNPVKAFASTFDKSIMEEWERFFVEEMDATELFDPEKVREDYWDSIRHRCQDQYVLGSTLFVLNNEHEIKKIAEDLFNTLVMPKSGNIIHREGYRWATVFLKKFKFFDKKYYKHPIEQKKELHLEGIRFKLPFYQKNGLHRAIWTAKTNSSQDGIITPQGKSYISDKTILSELWGKDAEFVLLAREYDEENTDIKAAKIAKVEVMPINDKETEKYFRSACEPANSLNLGD